MRLTSSTSTLCVLNLGPFTHLSRLFLPSYLGGACSTSTDITRAEHLLISQNSFVCILLAIQELLEGAKASLVLLDQVSTNFLHQPTYLILILLHLTEKRNISLCCYVMPILMDILLLPYYQCTPENRVFKPVKK